MQAQTPTPAPDAASQPANPQNMRKIRAALLTFEFCAFVSAIAALAQGTNLDAGLYNVCIKFTSYSPSDCLGWYRGVLGAVMTFCIVGMALTGHEIAFEEKPDYRAKFHGLILGRVVESIWYQVAGMLLWLMNALILLISLTKYQVLIDTSIPFDRSFVVSAVFCFFCVFIYILRILSRRLGVSVAKPENGGADAKVAEEGKALPPPPPMSQQQISAPSPPGSQQQPGAPVPLVPLQNTSGAATLPTTNSNTTAAPAGSGQPPYSGYVTRDMGPMEQGPASPTQFIQNPSQTTLGGTETIMVTSTALTVTSDQAEPHWAFALLVGPMNVKQSSVELPSNASPLTVEYAFSPTNQDEILCNHGDLVKLKVVFRDGWATVLNVNTEQTGQIPLECLRLASTKHNYFGPGNRNESKVLSGFPKSGFPSAPTHSYSALPALPPGVPVAPPSLPMTTPMGGDVRGPGF